MDHEHLRGGAYLTLCDESRFGYRIDPDGEGLEIVVYGPMELSIGMTPQVLRRCQELLAEAQHAVTSARRPNRVPRP
jgi:hypothetical protein